MAVPEQIPVVNYVADGIVNKFDVSFEYDQQSDLYIYVDGAEPTIDKYYFADNAFNFYVAPTSGQDVKIKRITPKERDTDYDLHTNTVRPKALNTDFDRLWYVLQEVFSDVGGLSQTVQDEIIARIHGDEDLLNQLTAEISARMLGDEAVTEDLKNYVNQVVSVIIGDPSFTGIDAKNVNDASGETQQQVNYNGGSKWHPRVGGYKQNERVILTNGDIVKSTVNGNTNDPNVDMTGWDYAGLVEDRTYGNVLGSPVKFKLNPIKASFLYGISDPTHLDDNLNNFRGLNNPDAYHDSNVAIGAVSFGRNNPPFAYLSLAGGHDCVPFGVASFVLGAGSCTGNPDVPGDGANYGYCSLAVGKDTQARGRISNAMGERNISASRYSSTDGYGCIAGPQIAQLAGDVESEGAAARAHGYKSEAYGNFAFAYGSFLKSFNGAQVLGQGINEGSTLNIRKRGLALGYNVDVPTIFCQSGSGVNGAQAQIGFNTSDPISKYDFRYKNSEVVSHVIDNLGFGAVSFDVVGLLNEGEYGSLYKVVTTHTNAGQPYGTTTFYQNNIKVMSMNEVGNLAISPKATANPTNNGDLVLELTSNTQLKVKVKGSDGVVRSTTLTLA